MTENVKRFFEELERNDKALELLKAASADGKEPDFAALADIARQTGYDVTDEEMETCLEEERKRRAAASDAVADKLGELSPQEMDIAAGGKGDEVCKDTFNIGEWCWSNDSCMLHHTQYIISTCHYTYKKGEWCFKQDSCEQVFIQY